MRAPAVASVWMLAAFLSAPAAQVDVTNVLLVGDIMLGRLINETLKTKAPAFPLGDTLPMFERADVAIANLECVIADKGTPWNKTPKVFHYRTDARNVVVLQTASLDFVSVANNHVLDYGYFALRDMLEILDHAGVRHAGAGANTAEACQPAFMDVRGTRVGFLAFTDNEPAWASKDDYPGICYSRVDPEDPRAKSILDRVKQTRREASLVIVSAHWGGNWGFEPPQEHTAFARALIDAGADIVYGHSAHVFRGIEIYKGKPILYSTGDFVDDYAVEQQRNDQSFLYQIEATSRGIRELRLYPTVIHMFQSRRATGQLAEQIARRMATLSVPFKTASNWDAKEGCLRIRVQ